MSNSNITDEIKAYSKASISLDTGEIELWDKVIFTNVIRKREIRLICVALDKSKPRKILDYGCGAGWLSKMLLAKGYNVVGIDASDYLIENARKLCPQGEFVVGDCMDLPFKNGEFDFIVGCGILHHLDMGKALSECYRVVSSGHLLLLEPNKYNPIASLARKMIHVQTKGESPINPRELERKLTETGWNIQLVRYLFPFSFALSYFLKGIGFGNSQWLKYICPLVMSADWVVEKAPLLNELNYVVAVEALK